MDGQWNNTRLPPRRTEGILPVVRQLNSVRRETGRRFNSSFSSIKPASPDGALCSDVLFIAATLHAHFIYSKESYIFGIKNSAVRTKTAREAVNRILADAADAILELDPYAAARRPRRA